MQSVLQDTVSSFLCCTLAVWTLNSIMCALPLALKFPYFLWFLLFLPLSALPWIYILLCLKFIIIYLTILEAGEVLFACFWYSVNKARHMFYDHFAPCLTQLVDVIILSMNLWCACPLLCYAYILIVSNKVIVTVRMCELGVTLYYTMHFPEILCNEMLW